MRKISLFLALIISLFITYNVHASTYTDTINEHGMWISNEYVNKTKNGSTKYQQMTMIVRNSDGRFLYCIEPGKSINENNAFIGYDEYQSSYANLTKEQWDRINLIAYYGYGYLGHEDIKWYVITQFMIWQTNNLGYDIYFTDRLNGNKIIKYEDEINEIEELICNHYKKPAFENDLVGLLLGDDYIFIDNNNVLNQYGINKNQNIELFTYNNELHLKNSDGNIENGRINFYKKSDRFSNLPTVYLDGESQRLLLPGNLDDINYAFFFYTIYGSVNVKKEDSEGKYYNQASLENATYALYDSNSNIIETKTTDENGNIHFDSKLAKGDYYFKELDPSIGYQLDENEYHFNNNRNDYRHDWTVREKVIKENFEIIKYIKDDNVLIPENNIEFGIYDYKDNLLYVYNTSNLGTINFSLAYGKYILKQHTVYEGYEKIKDYYFEVKENNKYNKLIFIDNKIENEEEPKVEEEIKMIETEKLKEEPKEELKEIIQEEPIEEFTDEDLIVEVPNTLKNSNTSLLCLLIFIIYIKKKINL